jgi:hypothetical protein
MDVLSHEDPCSSLTLGVLLSQISTTVIVRPIGVDEKLSRLYLLIRILRYQKITSSV